MNLRLLACASAGLAIGAAVGWGADRILYGPAAGARWIVLAAIMGAFGARAGIRLSRGAAPKAM